jgi:hypothetical protein
MQNYLYDSLSNLFLCQYKKKRAVVVDNNNGEKKKKSPFDVML